MPALDLGETLCSLQYVHTQATVDEWCAEERVFFWVVFFFFISTYCLS